MISFCVVKKSFWNIEDVSGRQVVIIVGVDCNLWKEIMFSDCFVGGILILVFLCLSYLGVIQGLYQVDLFFSEDKGLFILIIYILNEFICFFNNMDVLIYVG